MDADRTPSARGGPAIEDSSRRGVRDAGTHRFDAGDVLIGVLPPNPDWDEEAGPVAVPEAHVLVDRLASRRHHPVTGVAGRVRSAPAPGIDRSNRTGSRLGWVYAVVVVALVAALAVGAASRAHLHRTDTQLTAMRARLHQTVGRAKVAEARLAAVTGQATSAARVLTAETDQLTSVQSQLASTEANVFANGVSISDLDTCLAGVEQALNQISLGDQHGAATTLNGVAASCRGAAPAP